MPGHDSDLTSAILAWEAHTQLAVGRLIRRRLAEHPPPGGTRIEGDFQQWADALIDDGCERLQALGLSTEGPADVV